MAVRLRNRRRRRGQALLEFALVLPPHIKADKFVRTVITAVQANQDMLRCERRSFITSCMKAAQDGLLPDGREAAIVPFNTRQKTADGWQSVKLAQYMPMVWGLRKKILQSGEITDLFAGVVFRQEIESDRFVYEEGSERCLRHKPIIAADFRPTNDDIALVYSVATFSDGSKSFEVMRRWEIDQIREASQTGAAFDKQGQPRDPKGPWVDWFAEMAKKSVIRRHSKSLPMSGDILLDVEAEDMGHAARSTVALLGSVAPDTPTPITGDGEAFDPATGELEGQPEAEVSVVETRPRRERKPRQPRQPRNQEAPAPEAEPEGQPEVAETSTDEPETESEPATDVNGVTDDSPSTMAAFYIERARRVEFILDLDKLEREAELTLAEMPPEIANEVDLAFDAARERLGGAAQ